LLLQYYAGTHTGLPLSAVLKTALKWAAYGIKHGVGAFQHLLSKLKAKTRKKISPVPEKQASLPNAKQSSTILRSAAVDT
jgi:hypothetical protein